MKKKEKGFALPVSLLLLVVMTLMGVTLVGITSQDIKDNDEKDTSQQAFYAAESGIAHAKRWMRNPVNVTTLNTKPTQSLNNNTLRWCRTNFLPNFNGNKAFVVIRKTLSEMFVGQTGAGETSRYKGFSFEYFITYTPDKNGNINLNSPKKKPGTNKIYYSIYSCGCDNRKINCDNTKDKVVSLEAIVTMSSQ